MEIGYLYVDTQKILILFGVIFALRFVPARTAESIEIRAGNGIVPRKWSREMWSSLSNSLLIGLAAGFVIYLYTGFSLAVVVFPAVAPNFIAPWVRAPAVTGNPFTIWENGQIVFSFWKSCASVLTWAICIGVLYGVFYLAM